MKKILLVVLLFATSVASAQKNTSLSYIDKFKDDAVRIMHETGVPASLILAIAMHESANGNSAIAQNLNNQFGFKGSKAIVYDKNGKKVKTLYKQYDSIVDSFQDFARMITEKKKFSALTTQFTHYDYLGWVHGIAKVGYASDRRWSKLVLQVIQKYQLNTLDENPEDNQSATATTAELK